jgi:hypothetical protein
MAEEIEIIVTASGFDKVSTGLKNTNEALKTTANEAKKTGEALKGSLNAGSNTAGQSLTNLSRIASDAPFGFIGIANNISPLVESFGRLKAETGSTGGALKALVGGLSGAGGIGLAFSVVTAAVTFAQIGFQAWTRKTKEAKEAADETTKALQSITGELGKEASQVTSFIAVLNNESESRERKVAALKELKQINPQIFGDLDIEKGKVSGLSQAYNLYIESLKSTITAKVLQGRIEKELTKLIELQGGALTESEQAIANIGGNLQTLQAKRLKEFGDEGANAAIKLEELGKSVDRKKQQDIEALKNKIAGLTTELTKLSTSIKLPTIVPKEQKEKVEKAKKALETFNDVILKTVKNVADQKELSLVIDQSTIKDQIKIVRDAIERGIKDFNQPGNDQRILTLKAMLDDLEAQQAIEDAGEKIQKKAKSKIGQGKLTIKVPVIVNPDAVIPIKELQETLKKSFAIIGVGLGEGIANAISEGANFGDVFITIFQQLGGVVQALGEQILAIGIAAIVASDSLKSIFVNPYAAIAAGVALVALGSLIKNTTTPKNRFAVGTRNAPGGLALVGERGPEMINLPRGSQVIPAAQTANMMGASEGKVEIYGILRGQDIYFSNKKYSATYARTT